MLSKHDKTKLLEGLAESGVLKDAHLLTGQLAVTGRRTIRGKRIQLRLELPNSFPSKLPNIYIEPWDVLGFIPHVERDGKVCYIDNEGLVIDRRSPSLVLIRAVEDAIGVIQRGATGDNADDFASEFELYWKRREDVKPVRSLVESGGELRCVVWANFNNTGGQSEILADTDVQIEAFAGTQCVRGKYTVHNAVFIPLKSDARIIPPRYDAPFWSSKELRKIVWENVSSKDRKDLRRLCKKCAGRRGMIILGIPKPDGTRTLVCVYFEQAEKSHPLISPDHTETLQPRQLHRHDQGYLVPRGGGYTNLSEKKVLVVGCGAVGSHLIMALAQTGVLNLTLVDPDTMNPENTFRHILGRGYWYEKKAIALTTLLKKSFPYVSVEGMDCSIEHAVEEQKVAFPDFDLVVFATGDPTIELEMNEQLHSKTSSPPAIHTWLEPYGIGGHAFLTGNIGDGACFECLYQTADTEAPYNRASFAASGQSFGKTVSGCGSLFTPYGALDAVQTATVAARLAIDLLTGGEPGNPLLSWKGNSDQFEAAGFKVSNRYAMSEQQLNEHRYAFAAHDCPVCQKEPSTIGPERR